MSTDFYVVCDVCRRYHHLGQHMGGDYTFGRGSKDEGGRRAAMRFVCAHLAYDLDAAACDPAAPAWGRYGADPDGTPRDTCGAKALRVVLTDHVPDDYTDAGEEQEGGGDDGP
jgi:hypothetical protein